MCLEQIKERHERIVSDLKLLEKKVSELEKLAAEYTKNIAIAKQMLESYKEAV